MDDRNSDAILAYYAPLSEDLIKAEKLQAVESLAEI